MAVLIEAVTLVLKRESLARKWPGGIEAFAALCPEGAFADDGKLVACMVDDPSTLCRLGATLERRGLSLAEAEDVEAVAIHQLDGAFNWCPWLELGLIEPSPCQPVLAARLAGDERTELTAPAGWSWPRSRSREFGVAKLPPAERPLRYLGSEGNEAVYRDRFTGETLRLLQEPRERLVVECGAGGSHAIDAEVVSGGDLCALGLMHRESLGPDAGMLFRLGDRAFGGFWMKNTLIPLDMLFLDRHGRIVEIAERAKPMCLDDHGGNRPFSMVLELNGGWVAGHGVRVGDRVAGAEGGMR